jgi:hypothetical protein
VKVAFSSFFTPPASTTSEPSLGRIGRAFVHHNLETRAFCKDAQHARFAVLQPGHQEENDAGAYPLSPLMSGRR